MSSLKAIRREGRPVSSVEGAAHPGGARDLAEGADMRQAGGAVAGLEQRARPCRISPAARRPCALPRRARPSRRRDRRAGWSSRRRIHPAGGGGVIGGAGRFATPPLRHAAPGMRPRGRKHWSAAALRYATGPSTVQGPCRVMRVGIVGATGAVGRELVDVLGRRAFPVTSLRLFASARSAGTDRQNALRRHHDRGLQRRGGARPRPRAAGRLGRLRQGPCAGHGRGRASR